MSQHPHGPVPDRPDEPQDQPTQEQPTQEQPTQEQIDSALRVRRTRQPRYGVFVGTGVLLGLLAAAVLAYLGDPQEYTRAALFGYLATALTVLGAVLGGLAAVLATPRTPKRPH